MNTPAPTDPTGAEVNTDQPADVIERVDVYVRIKDNDTRDIHTREVEDGINLDVDANGEVLGVEVLGAQAVEINGKAASPAPQSDTLRQVDSELAAGMSQIAGLLGMDPEAGEVGPIIERIRQLAAQGDTADREAHTAVVESLKETASELHSRPPEEMNADWADRMADDLIRRGLVHGQNGDTAVERMARAARARFEHIDRWNELHPAARETWRDAIRAALTALRGGDHA